MDLRACFLGDSYVLGQGDETGLGWPGRVFTAARADGAELTIYNLGVRGDTAAQVSFRAEAETKARFRTGDKKAVVLSFGANDIGQGAPLAETLDELERLLSWATWAGYDAFVLSPPVMLGVRAEAAAAMTSAMAAHCASVGVPFLDLSQAVADWNLWWDQAAAGDGVHPGAEAYGLVAEAFVAWTPWREWLGV